MSEDGTLNYLKKKWWYDRSECPGGITKVRYARQGNFIFFFPRLYRIPNKVMHYIYRMLRVFFIY